jgi:ubiquitin C-terminal hydrolase
MDKFAKRIFVCTAFSLLLINCDCCCVNLQREEWTSDQVYDALLYAWAGTENTLVLHWKKHGIKVYKSGMCPHAEEAAVKNLDSINKKLKKADKNEKIWTAFDIVYLLGYYEIHHKYPKDDIDHLNIIDIYNNVKKFINEPNGKINEGTIKDEISIIINGMIKYFEYISNFIGGLEVDYSQKGKIKIKNVSPSSEQNFPAKGGKLLIDKQHLDKITRFLNVLLAVINLGAKEINVTYEDILKTALDKILLINEKITPSIANKEEVPLFYNGKESSYKIDSDFVDLYNEIKLAAHTEIQALVLGETIYKGEHFHKNVFSTKLPCLNCAAFLAYGKNSSLFSGCNFIAVKTAGIDKDTCSFYPWKFHQHKISLKGSNIAINKLIPIALSVGNDKESSVPTFSFDKSIESLPSEFTEFYSDSRCVSNVSMTDSDTSTLSKETQDDEVDNNIIPGLENVGNSCYLNASMQALFALKPFRDQILKEPNKDNLRGELSELFSKMSKHNGVRIEMKNHYGTIKQKLEINANPFAKQMDKTQQDAEEFLTAILDTITANDKTDTIAKETKNILQFSFKESRKCAKCAYTTNKEGTMNILQIPIANKPLVDCINDIKSETMTGTEQPTCEQEVDSAQCGKNDARKEVRLITLPRVLIVQLKRFTWDKKNERAKKIFDNVTYEDTLKIPSEICANPRIVKTYKLKAVVDHNGSCMGGHYTATVFDESNKKWYICSDSTTSLNNKNGSFSHSENAYILMYEEETEVQPTSET